MQAKVIVETENEFRKWIGQQPKLGKQVAEEKAAATAPKVEAQPVQTPVAEPQIVVDTTAVVAQVIK